jgi:hypothetical protein
MKLKILNEEPEGNLVVLLSGQDGFKWDHIVAPSGSLECHLTEFETITIFKEYNNE